MKFSSMSPADRMKASGLIGLIVIVLFFVVHTMLGAISPKKPTAPPPSPPAAGAVPSPPPPTTGGDNPDAARVEGFPTNKIAAYQRDSAQDTLSLNINDPFNPIRDPNAKPATAEGHPRSAEPMVSVQVPGFDPHRPVGAVDPPPMRPVSSPARSGGLPGLASLFGPGGPSSPGPGLGSQPVEIAPPPVEPEIRLIGVVHGEPSVATVQVDGRTLVIRPGDALAKGYRVVAIHAEGIVIRHDGERLLVRVGTAINEPKREGR